MRKIRAALCGVLVVATVGGLPGVAASEEGERSPSARHEAKLASSQKSKVQGALRAEATKARGRDVTAVVQAEDLDAAAEDVRAAGGDVVRAVGTFLEVHVDRDALDHLAASGSITQVRMPQVPIALSVDGEEIAASLADSYHTDGFDGTGVKIAVIDVGFAGLANAQTAGDLPGTLTQDGTLCVDDETTDHGTTVAEIVHEMAPGADLFLVCIDSALDVEAAVDYVIAQGIDIVNTSLGFYNTGPGDGTGEDGSPDAEVARAADNGILWITAAGNNAEAHWQGPHSDSDDFVVDFDDDDETLTIYAEGVTSVYFRWDEWDSSVDDYDVYLYDGEGTLIAGSEDFQTGPEPPIEQFAFNAGVGDFYFIVIEHFDGPRDATELEVFLGGAALILDHPVAAGSLPEPADSPDVVTVGAACWEDGLLESFSSRGPTLDGRTKPDIVGYDGVSSTTAGVATSCDDGFLGTSAASPGVAGGAALLMEENPSGSIGDITTTLLSTAVATSPTSSWGAGLLRLKGVPTPPRDASAARGNAKVTVSWDPPGTDGGSDITGYTVYPVEEGVPLASVPVDPTSTNVVVTGLTNGESYTFTVTATNAEGESEPSEPTAAVSPRASGGGGGGGGGGGSSSSSTTTTTQPTTQPKSVPLRRLAGTNRIGTAIAIAQDAFPQSGTAPAVVLTDSRGFADAIAGAPLAAHVGGPLLVTPGALDGAVLAEIQRLLAPGGTVWVLGGTASVDGAAEASLRGAGFAVQRVAGANRYATATAVAAAVGGSGPIFVATGQDFPDALAAGAAAVQAGGVIVLSAGSALPGETASYLGSRPGANVIAVGGPAAAAVNETEALVGANRYATAVAIAQRFFTGPTSVTFASGTTSADALAGGAHAGRRHAPLLLVAPDQVPGEVSDYLATVKGGLADAVAYGGSAAIGDGTAASISTAMASG